MKHVFDTADFAEEQFSIAGADYVVREASGDVVVKYRNRTLAATRFKDGKVVSIDGAADADPWFVSRCMYDAQGRLVPEATIRAWPNRIQKALVDVARRLARLDEDAQLTVEDIDQRIQELQARRDALSPKA